MSGLPDMFAGLRSSSELQGDKILGHNFYRLSFWVRCRERYAVESGQVSLKASESSVWRQFGHCRRDCFVVRALSNA